MDERPVLDTTFEALRIVPFVRINIEKMVDDKVGGMPVDTAKGGGTRKADTYLPLVVVGG